MKNIGTVELESNRLLFRKASTSDSNAMFNNWANDKEVTKYLRWDAYEKEEDTIKFLNYLENIVIFLLLNLMRYYVIFLYFQYVNQALLVQKVF